MNKMEFVDSNFYKAPKSSTSLYLESLHTIYLLIRYIKSASIHGV